MLDKTKSMMRYLPKKDIAAMVLYSDIPFVVDNPVVKYEVVKEVTENE